MVHFTQGTVESCKRSIMLSHSLTNRRAHHDLKDLVFAEARRPHGNNVLVDDRVGVVHDLVEQRACGHGRVCIIEGSAAMDA
jgi:hypothetical protein